jgi:hypothetical protein
MPANGRRHDRSSRSDSRGLLARVPQNSHVSWRIGFSTWLHRLAVNFVPMHLRKKSLLAVSIEATHNPDNETGSSNVDIAAPDLFLEGSLTE